MDLWWKIRGYSRIRMTSADPENRLRNLSRTYRMEDIRRVSDLVLEFSVASCEAESVLAYLEQQGDRTERIARHGWTELLKKIVKQPVLALFLLGMLLAALWLPSRIFFVRVQGNDRVSTRKILEAAEQAGVSFAASRSELRSEQVKNQLLEAIPELSWVGVNTSGCVATITVRERDSQPEQSLSGYGSVVAALDAVLTRITATSGTALYEPGQAVRAGDVLISGVTDLGICTRITQASGEVYGITSRTITARIPESTLLRGEKKDSKRYYSLIFVKNRINFYADSGILDTTCGKMRMVYQLRLPGGWELPVYLVVETCESAELTTAARPDSEALLTESAQGYLNQQMIAGQIIQSDYEIICEDGFCMLTGIYRCQELIGRYSSGVYLERDEN